MSETVWIVTGSTSQQTPYYSNESCRVLKRSNNYRPVPLDSLNGAWDECQHCAGEVEPPDPDFSDVVRKAGLPISKPDGNVFIGEVWTASRGFVDMGFENRSRSADRSFAEVAGDD